MCAMVPSHLEDVDIGLNAAELDGSMRIDCIDDEYVDDSGKLCPLCWY